jgi:hypothetical protein
MIVEVIHAMGIFLFILLTTLLGFGDSFLRLSTGSSDDKKFIEGDNFVMAAFTPTT